MNQIVTFRDISLLCYTFLDCIKACSSQLMSVAQHIHFCGEFAFCPTGLGAESCISGMHLPGITGTRSAIPWPSASCSLMVCHVQSRVICMKAAYPITGLYKNASFHIFRYSSTTNLKPIGVAGTRSVMFKALWLQFITNEDGRLPSNHCEFSASLLLKQPLFAISAWMCGGLS